LRRAAGEKRHERGVSVCHIPRMPLQRSCVAFVMSVFLGISTAAAQEVGVLSGVVRDTTGGVLPDAAVTLVDERTGLKRLASTDDEGTFRIEAVAGF
jgi:hypothetical protein